MDWAEGLHCAVTVCDTEGKVIYMNEKSRETFNKNGKSMVGQNLFPCHNERSQAMIRHMMESDTINAYTITKNLTRNSAEIRRVTNETFFASPVKIFSTV